MFIPLVTLLSTASAFYLPGVAPHDYSAGDKIGLYVNALSAVDSLLPLDYYDTRFHFCKPSKIVAQTESLGSILFGGKNHLFISKTDYTILHFNSKRLKKRNV
jgi:transmembrane 9 superfamily protein 2/4